MKILIKHNVTIETEGSEFVQTMADCISLSPKLSNSTPRPGTWMPHVNREVTEKDKQQHEKWRCNYDAMKQLITHHPDYQLKPVISSEEDLQEVKKLQEILDNAFLVFFDNTYVTLLFVICWILLQTITEAPFSIALLIYSLPS